MAVPSHFKFTFRGIFLETPEVWSFGVHFRRTLDASPDAGLDAIDQAGVTSAITGLLTGGGLAPINNGTELVDWRAYVIGTDGRMEGDPLRVDLAASHIKGPGGVRYPPQVALVVTTVGDNRGPARYGRFYLPGPSQSMDSDFRLTATNATAYADAAATFLKGISDSIDLPLTTSSSAACNVSSRGGADGTLQGVDHVEVGRVYDTLRTRRNSMKEERIVGGNIDW